MAIPGRLAEWLFQHREEQAEARRLATNLWHDSGWVFAQPTGKPIDPRADYQEWRDLLTASDVRSARLHDARHTTATMLLVLRTPIRPSWNSWAGRPRPWQAGTCTCRTQSNKDIAGQVGNLLWSPGDQQEAG